MAKRMLQISKVRVHLLLTPIRESVQTSFGIMRSRPAVFVQLIDQDGAFGWGEVWCNFPACSAEHRLRLMETVMAPLLTSRAFQDPAEASAWLTSATAVLALQAGEPGPFAQCIAGLDTALWDLSARRAEQPLWRHLGGTDSSVRVYASGINPQAPETVAGNCRAAGHRAFKLKIGFSWAADLANLARMREVLQPGDMLMADANQAWTLQEAMHKVTDLAPFRLAWLEEPLRADRPWVEWAALASASSTPIALGENVYGDEAFAAAIRSAALGAVQPDLAKWGGVSGMSRVFDLAASANVRCCPHFLGAGLGLLASAHVLAARGGDGLLEVDANDNPLRSLIAPQFDRPLDGSCRLGDEPGLGLTDPLGELRSWVVQ